MARLNEHTYLLTDHLLEVESEANKKIRTLF